MLACGPRKISYQDPEAVSYELIEDVEVEDQEAVDEAVAVVEKNIEAVEEQDMEKYLSTIVESGQQETKNELEEFFELYQLEHTALGITLLEEDDQSMLLEVMQQSIAESTAEGAEEYKDHIAVANYVLEKENEEWKISSTSIVENYFIE